MKIAVLNGVRLGVLLWGLSPLGAQEPQNPEYNSTRAWAFSTAATLGTVGVFYSFLRVAWWDKPQSKFFYNDDFDYALNVDKVAHFYGGYGISSLLSDGLLWSGVNPHKAYAASWLYSTAVQVAIDYKDGFTPGFGFSKWDVICGSTGALVPWIEYSLWGFEQKYVDLKFSYYQNSHAYADKYKQSFALDDYSNQTFWLSYYPFIKSSSYWNRVWGVDVGVSIDDEHTLKGPGYGSWIVYSGLDWNLEALFEAEKRSPFWQRSLRYLNHIKLPAPTLQVYPEVKMEWTFPVMLETSF